MAAETIASLSDLLLSSLLSSKQPSSTLLSPSTLKLTTTSSKPIHHISMTTKSSKAKHDDALNRVVYPSLVNANLVFFKSGNYNIEVVPKDGESEEQLVNDFRRSVYRAGVLQECRRRRFFESSQEKKKRKTKEAAKKNRKRPDSFILSLKYFTTFVKFVKAESVDFDFTDGQTLNQNHTQLKKSLRAETLKKTTITGHSLRKKLKFHIPTGPIDKPDLIPVQLS